MNHKSVQKTRKGVLSIGYRMGAALLSVLMLVSVTPIDTVMSVSAEETEPMFIITDKNGEGISGIIVKLIGTDGEPDVYSEPSDIAGIAVFDADKPEVGSSYTYCVDTDQYVPVESDVTVTIGEENFPIEITLYTPAPTGEIIPFNPALTFGDTVTFEVINVEGIGELYYQWYKDGTLLDDEISSTLTIAQVLPVDAGTYSCEVVSELSDADVKLICESDLSVSKSIPDIFLSVNPESESQYTDEGITLTAVISHPSNSEVSKPEGDVEFFVDGTSVGTAVLNDGKAALFSVLLNSDIPHNIYVQYFGDENYMGAASEQISYIVGKISPMEGTDYTRNIPNGENSWYKGGGSLEITPIGIFDQIREGEDGEWTSVLIKSEETSAAGSDVVFYLKNSESEEISNPKTISYKLDKMQPDKEEATPLWLDGRDGQREWKYEYCGDIYGEGKRNTDNFLYYVTLTAEDTVSGVAYFRWKYKDGDEWSENIPAADGTAEIAVNYNQWSKNRGIIVVACDMAGNLSDEVCVPTHNSLIVEYDRTGLQRYIDSKFEDVAEDDFDTGARFIYNQETPVVLTVSDDAFEASAITVSVNDEPVEVNWETDGAIHTGTICLLEGNSVVKISATGYEILANETGSRIVNGEYVSKIHTVDTTNPVISVTFDSEEHELSDDVNMIVSIYDKNFRADELFFFTLEAKDIQGNDISEFSSDDFLNGLKTALWEAEGDVHSAAVTFSMEAYYSFTLGYKDLANNSAVPYEAESFVIDKSAPTNLHIAYSTDPVGALLRTITFGYYNPSVTIRLYADDSITGVDYFNWTYTQENSTGTAENVDVQFGQIDFSDSEHFTYVNKTAVATFTLTADEFTQYRGCLRFTATDKAGHTSDVHYDSDHIVIVDTICPHREIAYPEPQIIRAQDTLEVFNGDKAAYVNEEKTNSIIYYDSTYGDTISVTLKITEANFYAEDVAVEINGIAYTVDDWSQNGDEWIGTIKLTNDGEYVITVAYTDRSGNSMPFYQSEKIVIDREMPVITKYEFTPSTVDGIDSAVSYVDFLEYGYYFRTGFTTNIYVSDSALSSGIERIVYRLVSYEGGKKQDEITGTLPVIDGVATLPIPVGFKGQLFTETYDYAGNKSDEVTTQAFVVDNTAPVIEVTDNNTTAFKDAAGNPLYVTDTSVTVTITDMISGIKEIGYVQNSEKDAIEKTNIVLNNTGYRIGESLGDGWIVSAMDMNLVTGITKTFSYDSDNNDITLIIDAMDRSGNQNSVTGNTFTVDKTPPVINIEFREDEDTDLYYNEKRIADITVIERNFDASLINTLIENKFGGVPNVIFTEVSNTEHKAVIIFDEGDYTFEMKGTDLGNHTAVVNYSGGNEKLFFVDITKPVITDNFIEFNNQETENSFNNDMTVSISITEHNFDPSLTKLRIFQKDAGSDHSTSDLTDVTVGFIDGITWSSSGDIHTTTFTISSDAVYRIEIAPADLAGNESDYRSTAVFEIDKTLPVVSARNGRIVSRDDIEFWDVYTYDRKDEPLPVVEFTDLNIDHVRYALTVWIPDYANSEATPVIKPEKESGVIQGGKFTLSDFAQDGVYALELTAVDVAGNTSALNINTYARLVEQDVLAYILNSNVENKSGLYSFQYENGTPISMRPDRFDDLDIMVFAKKDTNVDIVLRDTNAEEIYVNAQVDADNSIYGFTIYNFAVKADFFKENFSGDTDADLHLTVKNDDKRIDLGRIHIDNIAPTFELPADFSSWHWYFGEETRIITISNINELLDEKNCKVYDNGKEVGFTYSSEENTVVFTLGKGWHSVGIVLRDMAGNENNIQERVNIYVGYFWLWVIVSAFLFVICLASFIVIHGIRQKRMREDD